jgi:hypothetical protein
MIFYPLKGYENLYFISKNGKIKNKDGDIIKPFLSPDRYLRVQLFKDGKKRNFYLHRLLAIQFIPNHNNYKEIDHLDKNRQNNKLSNLIWTTRSKNNLNRNFDWLKK